MAVCYSEIVGAHQCASSSSLKKGCPFPMCHPVRISILECGQGMWHPCMKWLALTASKPTCLRIIPYFQGCKIHFKHLLCSFSSVHRRMFLFSLRKILQLPSFAYKCIFFLYLAINVVWNYFGGVQEGLFFPLMGNS